MRDETKKDIDNIVDCFTGADGGIRFAMFLGAVDIIDKQAKNEDQSSKELIKIITRFSSLINTLTKRRQS